MARTCGTLFTVLRWKFNLPDDFTSLAALHAAGGQADHLKSLSLRSFMDIVVDRTLRDSADTFH